MKENLKFLKKVKLVNTLENYLHYFRKIAGKFFVIKPENVMIF